jgi:hypothetical protein
MFGRKEQGSRWRSRFPEQVTCVRCLQVKDALEVDRLLWCRECQEAALQRAMAWGWGFGGAVAALLALWIWMVVKPSELVVGGWIATVAAAAWLAGRVGREVAYGMIRYRNTKAVEAVPPSPTSGGDT